MNGIYVIGTRIPFGIPFSLKHEDTVSFLENEDDSLGFKVLIQKPSTESNVENARGNKRQRIEGLVR